MPSYKVYNLRGNDGPPGLERAIAAVCYLTSGLAGILYIIFSRSGGRSDFFRFHFLQSIIIFMMDFLIQWIFNFMGMSVGMFTNAFLQPDMAFAPANLIGMLAGAVLGALYLLPLYGLIMAALGKYAEIPFLSDMVWRQIR